MNGPSELPVFIRTSSVIQHYVSLFQARRKRKRGQTTGARATKHSAKRIEHLFGGKENTVEYHTKRGVVRPARDLREAEIDNNDTWVRTPS